MTYPRWTYDCWTYEHRPDGVYAAYNRTERMTFTKMTGAGADRAWYEGMVALLRQDPTPTESLA